MSAGPVTVETRRLPREELIDKLAAILEAAGLGYVEARRTARLIVDTASPGSLVSVSP